MELSNGWNRKREGNANMTKVFLTIAKQPMSFMELHKSLKMNKVSLTRHLHFLEKKQAIYRDTIKPNETLKDEEIGKIVYKVVLDQIPEILRTTLSLLDSLSDPLENEELDRELQKHKIAIAKAIVEYINNYRQTRDEALKTDLRNLGVKDHKGTTRDVTK